MPTDRVWDRGLQPERTHLAWQRTALALLALALAVPRLTWPMDGPWWVVATVLLVAGALALLAAAQRRYRHTHRTLTTATGVLHDGRLPVFAAALATVLGLVALAGLLIL